ncbi:hypothetical protein B0H13DRAFT_2301600 [Mycena leptocephala]|nr:hypothetical protein B0H13DRAFT_2301600 [Mycena leptocephala]
MSGFYLILTSGAVFVQATVDGGSETGELYAAHVALRIARRNSKSRTRFKNTDNTPIEPSWHVFTNYVGLDIKQITLLGKSLNYFHHTFELIKCTANW